MRVGDAEGGWEIAMEGLGHTALANVCSAVVFISVHLGPAVTHTVESLGTFDLTSLI